MQFQDAVGLVKQTVSDWSEDRVPRMGAALACYSAFSIAPLVMLVIAVASLIFNREQVEQAIVGELRHTFGAPVAKAIAGIVTSADHTSATTATVIGVAVLLFGASGVFAELQDSLNSIWKVQPKPGRAVWTIIRDRFFSFTMVLGTGFLLLVSLVISTALAVLAKYLHADVGPWQAVNTLVSLAFIVAVFALIYKMVPDVQVSWHDVWLGALLAGVLFTLGKALLGWYLGLASTTSAYGAAGSLVAFLMWVYYSSQILLFGAEFTHVFARRYRHRVPPADNAVRLTREDLIRQGMPRQEDVEAAARAQEARQPPR
jgi:membrane protein